MATFVLIPGAGSDSWYWHLVVPELDAAGHDVVAVDLPCDDDSAGLAEYTDVVVARRVARCGYPVPAVPSGPLLPRRVPTPRRTRAPWFPPDEMNSGHLPALAHPQELAGRMLAYAAAS